MKKNTFSLFSLSACFRRICAMLLCMAILCGCGGTDIPNEDYIWTPYPPPPTNMELQIRWAFLNCLEDEHCPHIGLIGNLSNIASTDHISISLVGDYFGIVRIYYTLFDYVCSDSTWLELAVVDDYVWDHFFCDGVRLLYWDGLQFNTLQEAYDLGLLSQKDLSNFADNHCIHHHPYYNYEPCLNFFNNILSKTEE